jgi:hypothetical protein
MLATDDSNAAPAGLRVVACGSLELRIRGRARRRRLAILGRARMRRLAILGRARMRRLAILGRARRRASPASAKMPA